MLSDYNCCILDIGFAGKTISPKVEKNLIDDINFLGSLGFHKLVCQVPHYSNIRSPYLTKAHVKELEQTVKKTTSRKLSGKFQLKFVPVTLLTKNTPDQPDLKHLTVPKTNRIFLELPFSCQFPDSLAVAINKLLYSNKLIPVFTNFQIHALMYSDYDVNRLINIKGAAFQFSLTVYAVEKYIPLFKKILSNGGTVLLGSARDHYELNKKEISKCLKILRKKLTADEYTTMVLRARSVI